MKQILVATDGTEQGRLAVEQALDLARPAGAQLTIVFVRHAPSAVLGVPYYQRALSTELRHAEVVAAVAESQARVAGVDAEVEVLDGDPAGRIVELARAREADLIVVGSRDRGPIAETLLGSVSREILRHADRPVLIAARRAARSVAA
jgi:nucleotide-binding universal stress UspA family protein